MIKKLITPLILVCVILGLYLWLIDTPPSPSSKATQRSGHVLACMKLTCPTEGQTCSPEIVKACTDSAFNIYHDPSWEGEQQSISVLPSALQEAVEPNPTEESDVP